MTSKRKAELQRKLSMSAVPRPPAGLSDRIKADIPQYLQTEVDRARFSGSVAFSMRVAASILLLITTAFVTLRLLEPTPNNQIASFTPKPKLVPAVTRYEATAPAVAPPPQRAGEEVRLDITQESDAPLSVAPAAPQVAFAPQMAEGNRENGVAAGTFGSDEERKKDEGEGSASVGDAAGRLAPAAAAGALDDRQSIASSITAAEPPAAPVPAEAQVQTAESLAPAKALARDRAPSRTRSAPRAAAPAPVVMPAPPAEMPTPPSTSSLMSEAYADDLSLKQKPEVFGISVDPNVFIGVKASLQKGTRPTNGSVNIDALVNYFAGPPARAPRRSVNLEVEASPAPVEAEGDHAVLRFTVDTSRITVAPRSSTPPAATNARLEIEIDGKAVAHFHRIGGDAPIQQESTLLHNLSVTALYELELRPNLKATQRIATVRLRYRSVTDGKENVITRVVHGSDLARDWARASRRHRLASLGAVWSESLKTRATRADVAKRAEELATQEPEDTRARELANAASATAGGDEDRN